MISMAPLIILISISSILSAISYSYENFFVPAITGIIPQIMGISSLLFFSDRIGIISLPYGLIAGTGIQLLVISIYILNTLIKREQSFKWGISVSHPGIKQIGKLMIPRTFSISLMNFDLMVDRFFASLLGSSYISALAYSQRLISIPYTLVISAIGQTMMPVISKHYANNDRDFIRKMAPQIFGKVVYILIPTITFIILFRENIISILFQRGAFDSRSTELTSYALLFYSVGMISYCLNPLLKGIFFCIQDTMSPLKTGIIASIMNVILDLALMKILSYKGIALATSMVVTLNTVLLWHLLRAKIGSLNEKDVLKSVLKTGLAAIITGGILFMISHYLLSLTDEIMWKREVSLGLILIMGIFIFCVVSSLSKIQEYRYFSEIAGRKLKYISKSINLFVQGKK